MTQIEFTNRTKVEVSYNEFNAINEVYMNCDLDKDEFCKVWCKMNQSRVKKAIAAKKEAERQEKINSRLNDIFQSAQMNPNWNGMLFAYEFFSAEELLFLGEQGFETYDTMEFGYRHMVSASSLIHELGKKLGYYAA